MKKVDSHRLPLIFSEVELRRLDDIVKKTEAHTRVAAVRKALHFYAWALEQAEQNLPINLTPDITRLICGIQQTDSASNGGAA